MSNTSKKTALAAVAALGAVAVLGAASGVLSSKNLSASTALPPPTPVALTLFWSNSPV